MSKRFYFAAIIISLFAVVVWFADPFQLIVLGVAPLIWIGLPALLIGGIMLLRAMRTGRSCRLPINILLAVLGFVFFVNLAIPVNLLIQAQAVNEAKAYPGRVAPLLEAYKQKQGAYPVNLDQLPAKPPMPRLLRRLGYHADGQSYWFSFPLPGGLIDVWQYDSKTHAWHLST